ncbi:hypothetical protein ACFSTD_04765 [Novosphingobium colocasiae]
MRDDAVAAGARVQFAGSLADIADTPDRPLGDVVWLDCPLIDAQGLAVLAGLDMRAATGAVRLVVSTTVDALDDIYGWMDQSVPLLLVDPGRVDRVIALARVMAERPAGGGVRELSDDDRMMLMRLTEQVGAIAGRIEKLAPGGPAPAAAMPPPFADAGVGIGAGGRPAFFSRRTRTGRQTFPKRGWCAGSSASVSCGRGSSMAICSPIPPGICCSIWPPRGRKGCGSRSPRCASPRASRPPRRCAGSARWSKPASSPAPATTTTAAAPSSN